MTASICIFCVSYAFIATEKIDKAIAAMLGAATVIAFQLIPYDMAMAKIDLNVLLLLIGMMIVMHIISNTGVFEWLAVMVARQARGNGMLMLLELMAVTAFVSAWLDNVTTVVLIAPITILICEILDLKPVPFLILEAVASNIGGTATLIGDPPNVIIASGAGLTFNQFLLHLTPAVLMILAPLLLLLHLLLRSRVKTTPEARQRITLAHPERAILDPVLLRRSLGVFGLILVAFVLSHQLRLEPGIVAIAGALLMVLICRTPLRSALEHVEWDTILFFIGLFVLVGALEYRGVFRILGNGLLHVTGGDASSTALALLWFSGLASAVFGSIPVTMALLPLVEGFNSQFAGQPAGEALYWALALGACLGGNGTLVGAAANVVTAQLAHRNNYRISFWEFARYGAPITLLSLVISTLYVWWRYL